MLKRIWEYILSFFKKEEPPQKIDHSSAIEFMSNMKKVKSNPNIPSHLLTETPEQEAKRRFQETLELMKIRQQQESEENKSKLG